MSLPAIQCLKHATFKHNYIGTATFFASTFIITYQPIHVRILQ